ncbi:STM3941 family protein [Bradyrhizobium sp. CCBAU 11361]|uniref:STM3941 family protein n=1 Tax=Bradyrhizobium sp. CCBAU 11361 TaxID=1630812 RepID=UPI0023066507|nr:STM3941 family protein [Bradyrhizobium sp. CCBAU 11361]MDA9494996.1 hypothetical protein [Bradyrhizobium sp. CCBAU 11361]
MAMLGESMHAHPDGPPLAVTDGSQSVAPAVSIDAAHDLEINPCATSLRLLVAAGSAMTLLSASLAFGWWGDGLGDYDTTVGYAGVAVFGLVTSRLIWMLPAERRPVVIVTPYGIRDLRIGNEFLLWEAIAEVSTEERRGRRMIVLTLTPGLQRQLSCIHASVRSASRGVQDDRIIIRSDGLAIDFDTLLRACRDCHAASYSRTALRRDRDQGAPDSGPLSQGLAVQAS